MPRKLLFSVTLDDCKVECIASTSGNGGQNRNRRHTAVRITHPPSGAIGYSANEREQLKNKRLAFKKMVETKEFKNWHSMEVARRLGQPSIDDLVDREMAPENLKTEVFHQGTWQPIDETTKT